MFGRRGFGRRGGCLGSIITSLLGFILIAFLIYFIYTRFVTGGVDSNDITNVLGDFLHWGLDTAKAIAEYIIEFFTNETSGN